MSQTSDALKQQHTVDEAGIIRDLGKFEAEMYYAPYYWEQGLSGAFDEDENGVYFFLLGDTDYDMFPELKGEYGLAIEESEQGFVTLTSFPTKVAYDRSLARMVRDGAEAEEN